VVLPADFKPVSLVGGGENFTCGLPTPGDGPPPPPDVHRVRN